MPRDGSGPSPSGSPADHRPPRRKSILRSVLWAVFVFIRNTLCRAALIVAWLVKPIWPKAVYLRWLVLCRISRNQLDRGRLERAAAMANELLALSASYEDDWHYGNAVHHGHLVLGRIALRKGDTDAAKQHLLAAGRTPGSPQLDSFGPNMMLAKELLAAGEAETVLEYFELCGVFWAMGAPRLRRWAALVREGRTPDFRANLVY